MANPVCYNPRCETKPPLVHIAIEDTLSRRRYVCPACTATFFVESPLGPVIHAAPAVTAAAATAGLAAANWDDLADFFSDLF